MAAPKATVTYPVKLVAELPWAWEHHCGHINRGRWNNLSGCNGCGMIANVKSVVHEYLLIDIEPEKA